MHMTRKSLEECITNYHKWTEEVEYAVENLDKENEYLDNLKAAPKTQQYGIAATMPRSGGISDPTANAVMKKMRKKRELDPVIKRKQSSIQFVDERRQRLETVREEEILQSLMNGCDEETLCQQFGIADRTLRDIKNRIFKTMLKE